MQSNQSDLDFSWGVIAAVAAVFFVLSLFVFGASVRYGFLTFDDPYLIVNNLTVRGPTLHHIWRAFTSFDPELYIPLTFLSYQLNYLFSGLHPAFYHITNILIHAGNGVLVAYVAYLLLGRRWVSLFVGLLWTVHPLNTEAVVWLSARKDLLSTFFYLLTIALYVRYRYGGSRTFLYGSIGVFLLALLSKATVITLPAALLLLEALMRDTREWKKKVFFEIAPFAILSIIFAGIATFGKERVIGSSTLQGTVLMAAKSTVFYLEKLVIPINLVPIYPYNDPIEVASLDFTIPLLLALVLTIAIAFSLKRTKWIAVCFALFLISLAPSFLNFHKGSETFFAVDRYAYLPAIWLMMLLGAGLGEIADRLRGKMRRGILAICLSVLAVFAVLSSRQTQIWRDDDTLFSRVLVLYPESVSARMSLSMIYREQGDMISEEKVLREGLQYSKEIGYLTGLGSVSARRGDLDGAQKLYDEARAIDATNPEPLFFMGALEEQRGNAEAAIKNYEEAIALDLSFVAASTNLGAIYLDKRQLPEAETVLRKAIAWNPNSMEALYNLFQTLELLDRKAEALPYLEDAYALSPENAELVLAVAYRWHELGKSDDALDALRQLLSVEPGNLSAKRLTDFIRKAPTPNPSPGS